jgi:hypothetical protein
MIGMACANGTVHAIGGDDEVGVRKPGDVVHLAAKDQLDSQRRGAVLQDVE